MSEIRSQSQRPSVDPRTAKAGALRAWGDALMAAQHPPEAIGPYQQAVDSFPGWVDGFLALAKAQEAVNDLPAAAAAYRHLLELNPRVKVLFSSGYSVSVRTSATLEKGGCGFLQKRASRYRLFALQVPRIDPNRAGDSDDEPDLRYLVLRFQ